MRSARVKMHTALGWHGWRELTVLEALARRSPTNSPCKVEVDKSIRAEHSSPTGAAASVRKGRQQCEADGVWFVGENGGWF